jgi:hypothetical protein
MGNYSRDKNSEYKVFYRKNHYSGVWLQKGSPLIDSDWNEMTEVLQNSLYDIIKVLAGNGVPLSWQGTEESDDLSNNVLSFSIFSGDENPKNFKILAPEGKENIGLCLVDGREVLINSSVNYEGQPLFNNKTLAEQWGVPELKPFDISSSDDKPKIIYLDVWEREVNPNLVEDESISEHEKNRLNNMDIRLGKQACIHFRREWVVRVARSEDEMNSQKLPGHTYFTLAELKMKNNQLQFVDRRKIIYSLPCLYRLIIAQLKELATSLENVENTLLRHNHNGEKSHKIAPENLLGVKECVSAKNLNILTDGSEASSLHFHKFPKSTKYYNVPLVVFKDHNYDEVISLDSRLLLIGPDTVAGGKIPLYFPASSNLLDLKVVIEGRGLQSFQVNMSLRQKEEGAGFLHKEVWKTEPSVSESKEYSYPLQHITDAKSYYYLLLVCSSGNAISGATDVSININEIMFTYEC